MKQKLDRVRCIEVGQYMVKRQCTIRQAALAKKIPKSTIHQAITKRLKVYDFDLYQKVRKLLDKNKAERHIRGGEANRRKHAKCKK